MNQLSILSPELTFMEAAGQTDRVTGPDSWCYDIQKGLLLRAPLLCGANLFLQIGFNRAVRIAAVVGIYYLGGAGNQPGPDPITQQAYRITQP